MIRRREKDNGKEYKRERSCRHGLQKAQKGKERRRGLIKEGAYEGRPYSESAILSFSIVETDQWVHFFHEWECCERVYLEEVIGDLNDLLNTPIVSSEESSNGKDLDNGDHCTWTFYLLRTSKGDVTLRFCGESNGAYSESVEIEIAAEGEE